MLHKSHVWKLLAVTALGSTQLSGTALAQGDGADTERDEIIVQGEFERILDSRTETGSRLGLSVREVPAAIDVLTQDRFLERGLRTSNEALNSAAGVTATNSGGSPGSISMRGFSGAAVSTNYDGMHQPSTMVSRDYDSFAFDRIEILKGPASVLYGEGAIGGAVNLVPKKPFLDGQAFQGIAQYGSRDTFRVAGDVNMPLGEIVAVRGVVSYAGSDGYIDRTKNETLTGNLGVTIKPRDNLTIFLAAEYFWDTDGPTYWGTPLVPSSIARNPSDLITTDNGFVLDKALRDTNMQYQDALVRSDSTWLRSQITWEINDIWTLRNDLSYNNGDRLWRDAESYRFDPDTSGISRSPVYIRNKLDFWNERISLSADSTLFGHRNRFLAGAEHTENDHLSIRDFGSGTPVDPYDFEPGFFPEITPGDFSGADIRINAVFGENAFNVTDKLLLVVGGRYEEMKLDRTLEDPDGTTSYDTTYHPFSYRAGLVYDLMPKTQLYGQYTKAAAPVSTMVLMSLTNTEYKLTKGESAEVGVKSSFLDGDLDLTVSGYWIRESDIVTRDPSDPQIAIQGGAKSSRGVEIGVAAALTSQLRVDANAAILDAKFDELIEPGGADRSGNTPSNVPETVINLFAAYQFAQIPVKLTAGMRHSSEVYGDDANAVNIAGYTVFDASIGYTFSFGDLTLRARNLTDDFYVERGGSRTVYIAAPRTIDLTFRTKF